MRRFSKKIENTGDAVSVEGGEVNTGVKITGKKPRKIVVRNTGDATAIGEGSSANSGIIYTD